MIQKKRKRNGNTDIYYLLAFFFILTFGYFYWFGDYVIFFQEKQSLLIFSMEYLQKYFIKPGGLLEFIGEFLTRFYINPANGALILSVILTLPAIILYKINQQLLTKQSFSLSLLLVAPCLLLLMQTHYYNSMEYNLGYILALFYFLFIIRQNKRQNRYIILAIFPLVYYLIGGYIWIVFVMFILYSLLYEKGRPKYLYPAVFVIIAGITFLVFNAFIFIQPLEKFFTYPLPLVSDIRHTVIFYMLTGYVVIYPLLGKAPVIFNFKWKYLRPASLISVLIILTVTIFVLSKLYTPETRKVFKLQKCVFENKWNEAIELHETNPSKNMIGQFFYNIALSETDQLCDRLFFGRQDFGARALILPWENKFMNRGAHFYYTTGLINEAHRWAYESMVVYGYRPQNIKMLVKTNLINGNYRMAEKYINLLKKSFNYRTWAKEYETLLYNPKRIQSHPELGEKRKLLPNEDFFIQTKNPQNNIPELLQVNPTNRKAFEYKIAWYLLTKNVEPVVRHIKRMEELGYERLPRHVEEAVLAYSNSTGNMPPLGKFSVRQETKLRFRQYISTYKKMQQNPSWGRQQMQNQFSNTFWLYFHFKKINSGSNPTK